MPQGQLACLVPSSHSASRPAVLDLTLVDLPGITKVPVGDQPKGTSLSGGTSCWAPPLPLPPPLPARVWQHHKFRHSDVVHVNLFLARA
jgi:hypothetical protein